MTLHEEIRRQRKLMNLCEVAEGGKQGIPVAQLPPQDQLLFGKIFGNPELNGAGSPDYEGNYIKFPAHQFKYWDGEKGLPYKQKVEQNVKSFNDQSKDYAMRIEGWNDYEVEYDNDRYWEPSVVFAFYPKGMEPDPSQIATPLQEGLIREVEKVDDFFYFLENDERLKPGRMATATYVTSQNGKLSAKDPMNPDQPNSMLNRIYYAVRYIFHFGRTYEDAVKKVNPDYEVQARKGAEKIQGYNVLEHNAKGDLVLPIVPTGYEFKDVLILDESGKVQEKMDWKSMETKYAKYFRPSSVYKTYKPPAAGADFRPLILDNIYRIAAGGMEWVNPHFRFPNIVQHLR